MEYTFVFKCRRCKANIGVNNGLVHLGYYEIMEQAITARKEAEAVYWGK